MKYLAFDDPISGAKAMLGWLSGRGLLSYATAGDLPGYMVQLAKGCYLGCIGLTDPTGHTVSQQDYDNYQAGIATWMGKLANVSPEAPPMPSPAPAPSPRPVPGKPPRGSPVGFVVAAAGLGLGLLALRGSRRAPA